VSTTAHPAEAGAGTPVDTLLIDTDVHEYLRKVDDLLPYLPPVWRRFITEYGWRQLDIANGWPYAPTAPKRAEWTLPDGTMGTDVAKLGEHLLDGERVSIAILNGLFHVSALLAEFEFAQALASAYNDWQIANWLEKDPRVRGSVHVVAHDPAAAAREIDRVAEHPQIVQVFLPTVTDRQYGDPHYRPIFEAAVRNDLIVALHHGGHTRTALGYPRYFIEWHSMAAPQAGMNQLTSLMFGGVFDKYPDLKVALLETGVGWVPWFMGRLDQQYRELRIQVPWVKRLPSDHMRDSVRVSTQPMGEIKAADLVRIVEMADAERMFMFSSDYPHYDADTGPQVLPRALPEGLRNRVRHQNALETYPRLAGAR
jgi:predicted TIM-barrel fold metal-dependent hydrolase